MTIALDGMGSDQYPDPEVQAALTFVKETSESIILVGQKELLEKKLKALGGIAEQITIAHAPEVLTMTDHPVEGTRQKPNNSMAVGISLVKMVKPQPS